MKVLSLALIFVAAQAKYNPGLRGIAIDEDEQFYERILEEDVASFTAAPTPCSNILRECPESCFLEEGDAARPTNCSDPSVDREDCDTLPLPTDIEPACPDCCPDECRKDNPMFDDGDCAPTPLPSPSPSKAPTPSPSKAPTPSPTQLTIVLTDAPTPLPSASPSVVPSASPIEAPLPSLPPSPAPSPVPTPCKNLVDECPERCWEVDPLDRLPLCTDFNRPDCDTLPFPTDRSCPTCCPTQCIDAPELGDCSPTPVPTPAVSGSPSVGPTPTPTAEPTSSPSSNPTPCITPPNCPAICGEDIPPTNICSPQCIACPPQDCDIEIQINPNCPSLPCEWNICEERPFRMQFLFKGGDCSFSDFRRCPGNNPDYCTCTREKLAQEDWPNKITCEDFDGGPPSPSDRGSLSWLRLEGNGEIYFEGAVAVGSSFNASTTADEVAANTDIFIYEYDETNDGPGALLQEVVYHSSCSEEMYLADTFGSTQLTEFESENQLVSLFRTSTFSFDLTLQLNSDATSLELITANMVLLSSSFLEPQLQSLDVNGTTIPPALTVNADFTIIPEENHTAIASIGGKLDGRECFGLAQQTFNCPRG